MKHNIKIIIFFILSFTVLSSCNKEKYEAPKSATVAMSGRWWIELYQDVDGSGVPNPDDLLISYSDFGSFGLVTSNTSANDADSVLVDDPQGSWPFKFIAPVNLSTLTFTPATVVNLEIDGETVNIVEGKILKGAARSKAGRVADSIYFKFEFSDDLGNYYLYSGHRDSGQEDDQYH